MDRQDYQRVAVQDPSKAFASVSLKMGPAQSAEQIQYQSVPVKQHTLPPRALDNAQGLSVQASVQGPHPDIQLQKEYTSVSN